MALPDHPLLRSIVAWAGRRDDVLAVVLRGSREAAEGTGDSLADFDVDLHVADVGAFSGEAWLEEIAPVIVAGDEDEEDGVPVRLVFFRGQERVDFRLRTGEGPADGDDGPAVLYRRPAGDRGVAAGGATGTGDRATAPDDGGAGRPGADGPAGTLGAGPADATASPAPLGLPSGAGPVLRALVPVFSAPDVPAWLAHWGALGFVVRETPDGGGLATRDGLELRVVADGPAVPAARGHARAVVDDPDALHREWSAVPGGRTTAPEDRPDGSRDGVHADPAGNVLRFGRPG